MGWLQRGLWRTPSPNVWFHLCREVPEGPQAGVKQGRKCKAAGSWAPSPVLLLGTVLSFRDRGGPAFSNWLPVLPGSSSPCPRCALWRLRVPHRSPLPHSQPALYPFGARATRKPGRPVQPYRPSVPTAGCRSDAPTCPQTSHRLPEAAQAPGQGGKRPQELAEPTSCTPPPATLHQRPPGTCPHPGLPAPAHTPLPRLCSPAFLLCLMVRSHRQTNEKTLRVLQEPAHRTPHLKVIP